MSRNDHEMAISYIAWVGLSTAKLYNMDTMSWVMVRMWQCSVTVGFRNPFMTCRILYSPAANRGWPLPMHSQKDWPSEPIASESVGGFADQPLRTRL